MIAPASTAAASSPPWLACSHSSQKTRTRRISSTAISAFPGPSAPIRLTCWPGRSEPGPRRISRPGVTVTTTSALSASASVAATPTPSSAATARRRSGSTSHSTTSRPRAFRLLADARPLTPAPITAASPDRPSVSAASAAAAPVRSAVTAPASSSASTSPVSASESTTSPLTVGSPRAGLPGNDVTHFSSA